MVLTPRSIGPSDGNRPTGDALAARRRWGKNRARRKRPKLLQKPWIDAGKL